jgi:hypothetical protein
MHSFSTVLGIKQHKASLHPQPSLSLDSIDTHPYPSETFLFSGVDPKDTNIWLGKIEKISAWRAPCSNDFNNPWHNKTLVILFNRTNDWTFDKLNKPC